MGKRGYKVLIRSDPVHVVIAACLSLHLVRQGYEVQAMAGREPEVVELVNCTVRLRDFDAW